MKHFHSEYAFKKHKPQLSWRKRFLRFFRKKKYVVSSSQESFHYKTNPYKVHKKPRKIRIKAIIFIIFLLAWVVCLAYIPYFQINKVNYSGLNNTTKTEMDDFVYNNFLNKKSFLPLNNYFFINTGKITGDLYKNFAFESVSVTKVFPNQLNINIKEKISSIIYDNGRQYFLLDSGGTAIKYLKNVESYELTGTSSVGSPDFLAVGTSSASAFVTDTIVMSFTTSTAEHTPDYKKINQLFGKYPVVYDRRNLDIQIKQENILPPEHIAAIIAWYKALTEQGIGDPKFFALDNLNSGVIIDTTNSWDILFQPKDNTEERINTLKEILHTIKPQQYVDLRFGEKVYWK